jgi:hypothetical protein
MAESESYRSAQYIERPQPDLHTSQWSPTFPNVWKRNIFKTPSNSSLHKNMILWKDNQVFVNSRKKENLSGKKMYK